MIAIGQELYTLSEKDRRGQMIAPWFKRLASGIAIGVSTQTLEIETPNDRFVLVKNVAVELNAGTGLVTSFQVNGRPASFAGAGFQIFMIGGENFVNGVTGDFSTTPSATADVSRSVDILLPPSYQIQLVIIRNLTVATGGFTLNLFGYEIPSGNLVRLP